MAQFQATIRIFDVNEPDAPRAKRTLEERLQKSGFGRWQVVSLGVQGAAAPGRRQYRRPMRSEMSYAGSGMLVAAILAWALWFLWLVAT